MKILALIPAYNEAPRIARVAATALASLPVLVVDDGSRDDTARIAESIGAIVIRQVPNQGKGAALRNGFRYALENNYEAVVMLDADGQHDPAEIPLFLQAYQDQQADLVIGMRDFSKIPLIRRVSNTVGQWSFSWAIGQVIADNQSGYRMLSKRMLEAALSSLEAGFEFEVEMIVTCVQRGYKLAWVPISTIYADEKSHISPFKHVIQFYRMVFQTRQQMRQPRPKHEP